MIQATRMKDTVLLSPQAYGGGDSAVTANLDRIGSDHATIRIMFAIEANTNANGPTISLLESDDTVVTNFATIIADRTSEDLEAAKEVRYEVDCRARKRYLRLSITAATHTTDDDITLCAIGTLSRNEADPANTTDMGDDVVVLV